MEMCLGPGTAVILGNGHNFEINICLPQSSICRAKDEICNFIATWETAPATSSTIYSLRELPRAEVLNLWPTGDQVAHKILKCGLNQITMKLGNV